MKQSSMKTQSQISKGINKTNKQNRNRPIDKEQTDSCQMRGQLGTRWKDDGIKQKHKKANQLIDTGNNVVITRGKGGWVGGGKKV